MFDFVVRGVAIKFHASPAVQHNSRLTISYVLVSHVLASFGAFLQASCLSRHLLSFLKRSAPETHDADDGRHLAVDIQALQRGKMTVLVEQQKLK